ETVNFLRDRRAGAGLGRPLCLLQRRGGGSRRGAFAPESGGFHLRPGNPGRAGIRSGGEALIVMAGLVPAIPIDGHFGAILNEMAGSSPAMTSAEAWEVRAAANRLDPHHET